MMGPTELAVATLLPPVARWVCARAGLDRSLLIDPDHGFDAAYYERQASRRFQSSQAALYHYFTVGSRQGLRPRADFDPVCYRRRNPDVERAGYEPFAHYFHFGRSEGRGGTAVDDGPDDALLTMPDMSQMLERAPPPRSAAKVNVVIPVHGNRCLTLRTIDSVLASTASTPYELIVIDDASPDPALRRDLGLLAGKGLVTLLTNERNVGFVDTANRGLALHEGRDVVLLNSDTQVFGDWLDRLLGTLHGMTRTGTVSPMSNAATILSYPVFLRDNNRLPGLDFASLDRLCARLDYPPVELPTALGFCMVVKRACLEQVGPFDREKFGRGYGEENDFSLRAIAAGWQHLVATNVFVWHRGGGSFGPERGALIEAAQQTLECLHPGYAASVQRFIRSDPLQPVREALDVARIRDDPRRKVLWLGSRQPPDRETLVLALVPAIAPATDYYRVQASDFPPIPNLRPIRRDTSVADLVWIVQALDVQEMRGQPMGLWSAARWRRLRAAARMAGVTRP